MEGEEVVIGPFFQPINVGNFWLRELARNKKRSLFGGTKMKKDSWFILGSRRIASNAVLPA
jgi:hypothetical protein